MSLQLLISATEEPNSFIVQDCTGTFPDNQGGFGIHNIRIEDITDAFLEIIAPLPSSPIINPVGQMNGQPISPPMPPLFTINTTGDFPNKEGIGYEILPYMIGQSNQIPSGRYKIKLTISGVDKTGKKFTKTASKDKVFTNNVICCVDKLAKHVNGNVANDKKQQVIIELSNLVESLCRHEECGLLDQAQEITELLKAKCECVGC